MCAIFRDNFCSKSLLSSSLPLLVFSQYCFFLLLNKPSKLNETFGEFGIYIKEYEIEKCLRSIFNTNRIVVVFSFCFWFVEEMHLAISLNNNCQQSNNNNKTVRDVSMRKKRSVHVRTYTLAKCQRWEKKTTKTTIPSCNKHSKSIVFKLPISCWIIFIYISDRLPLNFILLHIWHRLLSR